MKLRFFAVCFRIFSIGKIIHRFIVRNKCCFYYLYIISKKYHLNLNLNFLQYLFINYFYYINKNLKILFIFLFKSEVLFLMGLLGFEMKIFSQRFYFTFLFFDKYLNVCFNPWWKCAFFFTSNVFDTDILRIFLRIILNGEIASWI